MKSDEKLFSEFPPISTEEWEEVINRDLKGADYEKRLIWKTDEGFQVRPYYREEDLVNLQHLNNAPNQFPYTRGYKTEKNCWNIVQEIKETDSKKANLIARDAIAKGANTLSFSAQKIKKYEDFCQLLSEIPLEKYGVQFYNVTNPLPFINDFIQYIENNKLNKELIRGFIDFDYITHLLKHKKYYKSAKDDFETLVKLVTLTEGLPNFQVINLGGIVLHHAGASLIQEIGYSLAIANEYLALLTDHGFSVDAIASKMSLTLSVGSNYFMEIAKLRAVRLLWSTLIKEYQAKTEASYQLHINSIGSKWNKTLYDPYVNLLRSTTEGMASALGGASSISLQPFDTVYNNENDFSQRINRNIQIILKEEAFFDKVIDPAAGSYYIENLTDSIASHAWELFKNTVDGEGIFSKIENGDIKKAIEESCQKRDMDVAARRYILVGTNQYPNIQEKMLNEIVIETEPKNGEGLKCYRGGVAFEELRLGTEKYAKSNGTPKVFLLKVGNVAMRQARAGFTTNFFGCAGFEIVDNQGFENIDEGVQKAIESQAKIVVLCSSDEEYETLGVEAIKKLKEKNPKLLVVIAGNPTAIIDILTASGADDFIHVKTNLLASLQNFQRKLNIIS